ncbi:hypothetical protein [Candidatus Poriferisodalis sp.]|uniref:hypothetical protein n=1 Tax=Candidatus Poriferisodalis sp. TaxID=3101277 RepID=UPI003B51F2B9
MSAIETSAGQPGNTPHGAVEAALERIARATRFYDFENAWILGLRAASTSDDNELRDRVLMAAGKRLSALGELKDDVARRRWLDQIADEVSLRSDGELSSELERVAVAELRKAFARAADDLCKLREAIASGESLTEFAARLPRPANRVRDLGRIAESLRSTELLVLCSAEDYGLARELARAMKPPVHLVPTVPDPLRVSRDDLIQWAKSGNADKEFPRLVRSLIAETEPSAEWIDMPAGTGVALPGFDGVVRCTRGNRYVPAGKSIWELTTQQGDTDRKAADDYTKRAQSSSPDQRAELAYVSAACAPWAKKRSFESERSGNGDFDRVRALGVDDLESWLECAVATTVWMREQIGRPTAGITLLAKWWKKWLAATDTPLDESVVLAGREQDAQDLLDRCKASRGAITVGGQVHRDEIIAFVAAALGGDAEDGDADHVLYVDNREAAAALFAQDALTTQPGLPSSAGVLTMVVPSAEFARHLPAGGPHRMIVPTPGSPQADVTLEAVDSEAVAKRLELAGFELHEAHELGSIARTSLMTLQRRLAEHPALHTPAWAKGHIDRDVRRTLLLGSWNNARQGDREMVERFVGRSCGDVTEDLRKMNPGDAPMASVGELWHSVSPADTWVLLRDRIDDADVQAFADVAHDVLTAIDPLRGLSGDEFFRAQIEGVEAKYSPHLRRGVATTLALAGSDPPAGQGAAASAQGLADGVVQRLLQSAMDDATPRTWTAISDTLPLLAEADPDAVLQALRKCLVDQHAFTEVILADRNRDLIDIGPSRPCLRIMETLQLVAWSPDHLHPATDVLARLAGRHPDGQLGTSRGGRDLNGSLQSLTSVMCPWMPHTSATVEVRLSAVRMLRQSVPGVAWPLMLSMLPSRHSVQTSGSPPRYRNWRPIQPTVSRREYAETVSTVAAMLLDDVGRDPQRWVDLIVRMGDFRSETRQDLVHRLRGVAESWPDESLKDLVWPVLRNFVTHHRQFSDTEWALPVAELEPLDGVLGLLRPSDTGVSYGHLFSSGTPTIEGVDIAAGWQARREALEQKQSEAIDEILHDRGFEAVLELAADADRPDQVGGALARNKPPRDREVVGALQSGDDTNTRFAMGYFNRRFAALGWDGIEQLLSEHRLAPREGAAVLRSAPADFEAWKSADEHRSDVASAYWEQVGPYELGHSHAIDELRSICRHLRDAERHDAVLELLWRELGSHWSSCEFASEVAESLEHWLNHLADASDVSALARPDLIELLRVLDAHRDCTGIDRLAMLEWHFHALLEHVPSFKAPNLYRGIASDPEMFVHLVELAFKPASAEPSDELAQDEHRQRIALNAYNVLHEWPAGHFAPGVDDDGTPNASQLDEWIDGVRAGLTDIDRRSVGDCMIGTALAASPPDPDGTWPAEAVRGLLERLDSDEVDDSLLIAVYNQRGVTSRSLTDGGAQERELAASYWEKGRRFREWPRTKAVFDKLASGYEHDAGVCDREAEVRRRGL